MGGIQWPHLRWPHLTPPQLGLLPSCTYAAWSVVVHSCTWSRGIPCERKAPGRQRPKMGRQGQGLSSPACPCCLRSVFPMEAIMAADRTPYHKVNKSLYIKGVIWILQQYCLKCNECGRKLEIANLNEHEKKLYCCSCYQVDNNHWISFAMLSSDPTGALCIKMCHSCSVSVFSLSPMPAPRQELLQTHEIHIPNPFIRFHPARSFFLSEFWNIRLLLETNGRILSFVTFSTTQGPVSSAQWHSCQWQQKDAGGLYHYI